MLALHRLGAGPAQCRSKHLGAFLRSLVTSIQTVTVRLRNRYHRPRSNRYQRGFAVVARQSVNSDGIGSGQTRIRRNSDGARRDDGAVPGVRPQAAGGPSRRESTSARKRSGPAGGRPHAPGSKGRSSHRGADVDRIHDDPGACPDLPSLARLVELRAQQWADDRNVSRLSAAFNKAAKLGADDTSHTALLRDTFGALAAAYLPLVPSLRDPKHCSLPLWACAKAAYWEGGLAAALVARLAADGGELLQRANGQSHSHLWWSLSTAPPELQSAEALRLSGEGLLRLPPRELNAQDCANVLLAAARLQRDSEPRLLNHMTACLAEAAPSATCQALANAMWAVGKLAERGHTPHQGHLQRLEGEAAARLEGRDGGGTGGSAGSARGAFKPQELSNMLWGCAKLGRSGSALLPPLAAAAGHAAGRMKAQEVSNSLYALAVLRCSGGEYGQALQSLLGAMKRLLSQQPQKLDDQHLSNTLWSLATLQLQLPGVRGLARGLAEEGERRGFVGFTPQTLSNAAWALSKMPLRGGSELYPEWYQAWFAAAVQAAMRLGLLRRATAQNASNLLYALALVRHRPPATHLAGFAASPPLRAQVIEQHCGNSLWALAILYGSSGALDEGSRCAVLRLVDVLAGRLRELLQRQSAGPGPMGQELCNSLWALAVMGPEALSRHRGLVKALLREVARRWEAGQGGAFCAEELVQLWQVQLELENTAESKGLSRILGAAAGLLGTVQEAAVSERQDSPTTSDLQNQVSRALASLQQQPGARPAILSVQSECWVAELGCRVDVVVELAGGRRVAVEVDGPTHFLANEPHTRTGRTQLRDRQLGRVFGPGNVANVPYWEWDELRGDRRKEKRYLSALLTLATPAAGSPADPPRTPEPWAPASLAKAVSPADAPGAARRQPRPRLASATGPAAGRSAAGAAAAEGQRPEQQPAQRERQPGKVLVPRGPRRRSHPGSRQAGYPRQGDGRSEAE